MMPRSLVYYEIYSIVELVSSYPTLVADKVDHLISVLISLNYLDIPSYSENLT